MLWSTVVSLCLSVVESGLLLAVEATGGGRDASLGDTRTFALPPARWLTLPSLLPGSGRWPGTAPCVVVAISLTATSTCCIDTLTKNVVHYRRPRHQGKLPTPQRLANRNRTSTCELSTRWREGFSGYSEVSLDRGSDSNSSPTLDDQATRNDAEGMRGRGIA